MPGNSNGTLYSGLTADKTSLPMSTPVDDIIPNIWGTVVVPHFSSLIERRMCPFLPSRINCTPTLKSPVGNTRSERTKW
ncbi:MAG: hypothetical protein ACFFDN_19010 [Candidatus Hodarchaeota archaeon]